MKYLWLAGAWLAASLGAMAGPHVEAVYFKLAAFACVVGFLETYRRSVIRDVKSALRSGVPDADL